MSTLGDAVGRGLAVLLAVASLAAAGAASAAAQSFPVPSCGWASSSLLSRTFADPVGAGKPTWSTFAAPVLTCGYFERRPKLQIGNDPIVLLQYAELQRYRPRSGSTYVKGLGECLSSDTCPAPGRPAWLYVQQSLSAAGPSGTQYISGVDLRVQDGLNAIELQVDNSEGPLTVPSEVAQVESLARLLLPKFYWP